MFAAGLVEETRGAARRAACAGPHRVAGAGLPAGAGRAGRRRPGRPRRGGRRDGAGDPAVRPPAALLVPPRPRGSTGWTTPGPDLLERAAFGTLRGSHDRRSRSARATAPRTTSCCSPTPTATLDLTAGPGRRAVRPPPRPRRRRRAAGGALGRAGRRPVPRRAGRRVVHGLPQRRRQRRRDVRQRRAGLRPLPADAGWLPDGRAPARHPGRGAHGARRPATEISVDMGPATVGPARTARVDGRAFAGIAVDVGNPHLACVTDATLDALDLTRPPGHDRALFPHGVNVEFVTPVATTRRVRDAGARARRGGDPLLRHRHGRRRRSAALRAAGRDTGDGRRCTPRAGGCGSPSSRRHDRAARPGGAGGLR